MSDLELLSKILQQEKTLRFPSFNAQIAYDFGTALRSRFLSLALNPPSSSESALWKGKGIVISISVFTGHTLFACACGEESELGPDNWVWVEGKKNVVKRFNHSSYYIGRRIASKGRTPESLGLIFPSFATHGGGFPIWIKGVPSAPIGAIVVSGLAQNEDHQIIVDTLTDFLPKLDMSPHLSPRETPLHITTGNNHNNSQIGLGPSPAKTHHTHRSSSGPSGQQLHHTSSPNPRRREASGGPVQFPIVEGQTQVRVDEEYQEHFSEI